MNYVVGVIVSRRCGASDDEHASTPLGEAVVSGVHDAPLHDVPEVGQGGEDDSEVPTPLGGGRFQEAVDILEEDEWATTELERAENLPPQHALLPLETARVAEGLGHRVVLARKATTYELMARNDVRLTLGAVHD